MEWEKIFDNEPRSPLLPDVGSRNAIPVSVCEGEYPVQREIEREREERGGSWGARPVLIIMHSVECCNYRAASLMHLSGWAYEKWTIVSFIWKWNGRGWTECDEKFWWPTETIILFLPFGEISHLCAFYRSEWDFLLLLFPLFLRSLCIILYRRWLKWKKRKKKKERSIVSII